MLVSWSRPSLSLGARHDFRDFLGQRVASHWTLLELSARRCRGRAVPLFLFLRLIPPLFFLVLHIVLWWCIDDTNHVWLHAQRLRGCRTRQQLACHEVLVSSSRASQHSTSRRIPTAPGMRTYSRAADPPSVPTRSSPHQCPRREHGSASPSPPCRASVASPRSGRESAVWPRHSAWVHILEP